MAEATAPHIWIIEDNLHNFKLMMRLLTAQGITGCEWKTANAALEWEAGSPPEVALILLDIYLPGEDGYQLLKRLRTLPHLARTRIVAITAEATPENMAQAQLAGFDGFIGKPINAALFAERIRAILDGQAVWELS